LSQTGVEQQRRNSVADQAEQLSPTILPIPDRKQVGLTTYDAKDPDTKFLPIEPLRPPTGAPNVLIVLLDDVGFAASSAFGGVINTPTVERLAKSGLKFNRFHTTALCSPTRQAMLTGRNHHSVNMAGVCEIATSAPGYTSILPKDKVPLAMTQAQWVFDGAVRQVSRGSGLGNEPNGTLRSMAVRRRWL
jgi:Sulfatase